MAVPHPSRKRSRAIWWLRGAAFLFFCAYLLLPYRLTANVPIWLPFLCVLAVEVQFFLGGIAGAPRPRRAGGVGRGPQERDVVDLSEWFEVELPQGGSLRIGAGELTGEEVAHWLAVNEAELAELPRGDYEVGPLRLDDGADLRPRLVSATASAGAPRRLARRLAIPVALAALTALLFLVPWRPGSWQRLSETKRVSAEVLYSRIASGIAGHSARVSCDTSGRHVGVTHDADGLAVVGGRQAWLTPAICYTLYQVKARAIRPDNAAAGRAIAVLAHESWHLQGEGSEALANCYGYQSGVAVGVKLGLSESAARSLMHEQLADNAADYAGAPAYVVPSGCHDGGRYDLHPANHAFP